MTETGEIKPSWWYASIGVVFVLAGAGLFVYFLFHGLSHLTDSLTQVVVPGHKELSLNKPATYTVFLEEQSVVDGRIYSTTEAVNGLNCSVTAQPGGQQIPLHHPRMSTTYNVSGRSGRSVLEFPVKVPGQYELSCNYPEDAKGPQTVVAVGAGIGEELLKTLLWCFVSILAASLPQGLSCS